MAPQRLPKTQRITRKDLRPGDVLLSYGQEPMSRMIRWLGGGSYSHAALWNGMHIVETSTEDITLVPLTDATDYQRYVDVYRWQTKDPPVTVLGAPGYESDPVTRYGTAIGKNGFGFATDEAVMLGLVVSLSRVPNILGAREAIRLALSMVSNWIDEHVLPGHRAMICTETVCTAFWQADPATRRYGIHIDVGGSRAIDVLQASTPQSGLHGILSPEEADAAELRRKAATLFLRASGQGGALLSAAAAGTAQTMGIAGLPIPAGPKVAGGPYVPLGCVTPHDLQHSPNLELVGRLSSKRAKPLPRTIWGRLVRALHIP